MPAAIPLAAAAVGAVGSVGASLLGGNSGGSTQQQTSSAPWGPQQGYLEDAFSQAQNVDQQRAAAGPYTGEFVAGGNDVQNSAINNANAYANGQGAALTGQVGNTASGLLGAAPGYVNNAQNMAANGIGGENAGLANTLNSFGTGQSSASGPSSALSSALNSAAVSGANSLSSFSSGLSNAANTATTDQTGQTIADANQYVNNPAVAGQISAANAQINNTLNEQTVPGLNREAAMGGSLNSSRAGMGEAMANNSAALDIGSTDAGIYDNAYNTGIATSTSQQATGLNAAVNANSLGYNDSSYNANNTASQQQGLTEYNAGNEVSAANSGLTQQLNSSLGNANTELNANSQLGSAASMGLTAANDSAGLAQGNYALQAAAGGLQQTNEQAADTNALDQWQMQNQYQQGVLDNYMGVVGGNYGSTSTGSTQSTLPTNYAGLATGGATAGLGLYQNISGDDTTDGSSGYDSNSAGADTLQSLGLYNPISS